MKSSKIIILLCVVVTLLILVIFIYNNSLDVGFEFETVTETQENYNSIQTAPVKLLTSNRTSNNDDQDTNKNTSIVPLEGNWCHAEKELSEENYQLYKSELNNWYEVIGNSRLNENPSAYADEDWYPINALVAPYEHLNNEELLSLALKDNKWAKVAYVQKPTNLKYRQEKLEIAKELLVEGLSYHALSYFVKDELAMAKTIYEQTKSRDKGKHHVENALAFVLWGLENVNESGLIAFTGITSKEPFLSFINLDEHNREHNENIRLKLSKIKELVFFQRESKGIDVQQPPNVAVKEFEFNVAIMKKISPEEFKKVEQFNVSDEFSFNKLSCLERNLSTLAETAPTI